MVHGQLDRASGVGCESVRTTPVCQAATGRRPQDNSRSPTRIFDKHDLECPPVQVVHRKPVCTSAWNGKDDPHAACGPVTATPLQEEANTNPGAGVRCADSAPIRTASDPRGPAKPVPDRKRCADTVNMSGFCNGTRTRTHGGVSPSPTAAGTPAHLTCRESWPDMGAAGIDGPCPKPSPLIPPPFRRTPDEERLHVGQCGDTRGRTRHAAGCEPGHQDRHRRSQGRYRQARGQCRDPAQKQRPASSPCARKQRADLKAVEADLLKWLFGELIALGSLFVALVNFLRSHRSQTPETVIRPPRHTRCNHQVISGGRHMRDRQTAVSRPFETDRHP